MFDIGFWEMAFIGVIALVVIGPERLPGVARTAGLWVGKARRMVADIKADVKKEMNEYDLQQVKDLKQEITSASQEFKDISDSDSDPLGLKEVGEQIKGTTKEINESLNEPLNEEQAAADSGSKGSGGKGSGGKKKAAKKAKKKKSKKKKAAGAGSGARKSTRKGSSGESNKKPAAGRSGTRKAVNGNSAGKAKKKPAAKKSRGKSSSGKGATEKKAKDARPAETDNAADGTTA